MEKKEVRIKDIAIKANVSAGTVDRVIHNRGRVSDEVIERVKKIIKQLDYQPNLSARALGSGKIYRLAALIPDPKFDSYWQAPKAGIEEAASDLKQYGIKVSQFAFNPHNAESFIEQAEKINASVPEGILLSPIFYREALPFLEKWKSQHIPFVLFNTQIPDFDPLSYVGQDSYQSGLLAAKLVHFGQSQAGSVLIAHIDEEIINAAHLIKKEQGFRNYFAQYELSHYTLIKAELSRVNLSSFTSQLDQIIEHTPDLKSVFVTTSKAHEVAKYFEQRFIKHINIIGYDLVPQNAYYLNNGAIKFLINQNPKGQGYWSVNQLADHLVFKKEVPYLKFLPLEIVTKENLNYYIDNQLV